MYTCNHSLVYIVAASEEKKHEVVVGKESFSLLERPSPTTQLVKNARAKLLMQLDVRVFTEELSKVGEFLRIAYNGLALRPELQGKVTILAIEITQLTDESAVSLVEFGLASDRVLTALETTYWHIYNDEEEFAKDSFTSIGRIAGNMAGIATKIHKSYKEVIDVIIELISETSSAQQSEKDKKTKLTQLQQELEANVKRAQKASEEALDAYKKYDGLFHDARRREKKAINAQSDPLKRLANAFTSHFGFGEAFDFKAYKNAEDAYRAEKYKYLEKMESYRKLKAESLADFAEFTQRIKNAKDNQEIADITIDALTKTVSGLKLISIAMLNAANYWNGIKAHCNNLKEIGSDAAEQFDRYYEKTNRDERRRLWRQRPFMIKAMDLYAQWTAIGSVCYDTAKDLRGPRYQLRDVIKESRSEQESLNILPQLAAKFHKELMSDIALLDEQGREHREAHRQEERQWDREDKHTEL